MPRIAFKNSQHPAVDLNQAVTVGRSAQHANVVVNDNRLSRAHCRFEPREDGWAVVDLESQNGTFLNGRRVREAAIKAGDVITIGACDMVFEETGGPGAKTVMAGVHSTRGTASLNLSEESEKLPPTKPVAERPADSTRTVVAPAALVLLKGTLKDKIHPITQDRFNIGRKNDNQLCLENDGKASGNHAYIKRDGLNFVIEDLGSTNGVVINGQRIEGPVVLKNGMKVLLGQQLFRFQLQGREAESSGRTAPAIASADIQARLKPPGQAGDEADMSELDDAQDDAPATVYTSASEQEVLNDDDDKAGLTQEIKFKSTGGALFGVIEILVVLVVAAAAMFAAWTMISDDNTGAGGEAGSYPPSRDGGLLAVNPSFDDADEGGYPKGWQYLVNETDSFALIEGGLGGRYALQISRFSPANEASYAISTRMEAKGKGVKVSGFAMNSEHASGRLGTAVLTVFWYAGQRDYEPLRVSPIAAATNLSDWTELSGSASAPAGARYFTVGVGLRGVQGAVSWDEISVAQDDAVEDWFEPHSLAAGDGMTWELTDRGRLVLKGPEGVYLDNGEIVLYQSDRRADGLPLYQMLTAKPVVERSEQGLSVKYSYFDPLSASNLQLQLALSSRDGRAVFAANVQTGGSGGDLQKAARYVAWYADLTANWAPAEIVRFEDPERPLAAYAMEIGVRGRGEFTTLLSADTGTGNKIHRDGGRAAKVVIQQESSTRVMVLQDDTYLRVSFERGQQRDELSERVALIAMVQPGEDEMDRVDRAVSIFRDFLYNQSAVASAASAIDSASKHYSLRVIELRDGINVPQLTRNEQLYRAAMEEAIQSAEKLNLEARRWDEGALPLLRGAISDHMHPRTKESAIIARDALRTLIELAVAFEQLANGSRKSLFLLEIEIEQRESEPFLISARDFLSSQQYVQGMVKLRTVVQNYPRCTRGIEAKERMVDVAQILLDEAEQYNTQGLGNISKDRALQARDLLNLVESKLLINILSERERQWLHEPDLPIEMDQATWIARETDLSRRIIDLRRKLPADLPPPEESEE